MHKQAISPVAHIEGDGLVHGFVFYPIGIVGADHHLLAPLVEPLEVFSQAEDLLPRREGKYRRHTAAVIGGAPHITEGQHRGEGIHIVGGMVGFSDQSSVGIIKFHMPGFLADDHRTSGVGITVASFDLFIFPALVAGGHPIHQHQRVLLRGGHLRSLPT